MAFVVQVILGSVREGRIGSLVADWVMERAAWHPGLAVELVDLKAVNLPIHSEPNHPRTGKYVQDSTLRWSKTVSRADGFVFVTPEYNHSIPPALKNALDHLNGEWNRKPVGFVSYGGVSAGTRAVEAILGVIACFEMVPVMKQVNMPFIHQSIKDGRCQAGETQETAARVMFETLERELVRAAR